MTTTKGNNFRQLLALAGKQQLLAAFLSALAASFCSLFLMGAAAWLIASAALTPPLSALALGITVVRACGIGRAVFRYLERWFSHRLAFRCHTALQLRLFDQAAAAIPLRSGVVAQGSWLKALTKDCRTLRDFYLRVLLPPVTAGLLSLLSALALFPVIGWLSLLLLLNGAFHILLPFFLNRQFTEASAAAANYRSMLLDCTAGHDELSSGGSWSYFLTELSQRADALAVCQYQEEQGTNRTNLLLQLLDALTLTGILFLLIQAVLLHVIHFIELGVWMLVLLELQSLYRPLAAASHALSQSLAAAKNLFTPPPPSAFSRRASAEKTIRIPFPLIQAEHLTFGYQQSLPILKDLSFAIHQGEHTAIIGDSGTGKTTLACLLCGCWPLDSGQLFLQGTDSQMLSCKEQCAFFASALQGFYIFPGSIRDAFLKLHPGLSDEAIHHALKLTLLESFPAEHSIRLDTQLAPDAANLSGGQRSRLLTALALVSDAPVLLLDEPTAGLDKKTASMLITNLLAELDAQQRTLLLITHDPFALERMKQVIRL